MGGLRHKQLERAKANALHISGSGCMMIDCFVQSGAKTDTGEWVLATCSNADCFTDGGMHLACHLKLQSGLVGGLRRQLRQVRDESDDDIASTLWTSKYNLCHSQCRCRWAPGSSSPR